MKEDFYKLHQTDDKWQIAALTEKEQAELKEMEKQFGYVLIAYENHEQKELKIIN